MKPLFILAAMVGTVVYIGTPRAAEAQVWKTIKQQTAKKVAERKARADSAIIARAAKTVDSTLAKSGRGLDTAVSVAAGFADQAVAKTEQTVVNATASLRGQDPEAEKLTADFASGRAVMREIRFEGVTEQLVGGADVHVSRLARLLKAQSGGVLVEVHVDPSTDAAADKALSDRRAMALKARLVAESIPVERVFVIGLGATRPAADGLPGNARIEVARLQ
ncbi:MAG TPA: OmpA family protein [Gemmatimonadaceae bacterium]|nr:OmpA family protein [Gemmatimonadaceae bacterium]